MHANSLGSSCKSIESYNLRVATQQWYCTTSMGPTAMKRIHCRSCCCDTIMNLKKAIVVTHIKKSRDFVSSCYWLRPASKSLLRSWCPERWSIHGGKLRKEWSLLQCECGSVEFTVTPQRFARPRNLSHNSYDKNAVHFLECSMAIALSYEKLLNAFLSTPWIGSGAISKRHSLIA